MLGRGSFGEVWLEKAATGPRQGKLRALKAVCKYNTSVAIDYSRELEAMAVFSSDPVRTYLPCCTARPAVCVYVYMGIATR